MNPIIFAILAAVLFGLLTTFHKLASPFINQLFGAILVSLAAVIVGGLVYFLTRDKNIQLVTNYKGVLFVVLAGVAAFFIDFLALQAYSRGLPLSIGGPIIIGGSMFTAEILGLFLGEPITVLKILGVVLMAFGAAILASLK